MKFMICLFSFLSLFFAGSVHAGGEAFGGVSKVYNASDPVVGSYLPNDFETLGFEVFGLNFGGYRFDSPTEVTFTTLFNSVSWTEGHAHFTDSLPSEVFSNQGTTLTATLNGDYYMWFEDSKLGLPNVTERAWVLGTPHSFNPPEPGDMFDPLWSIVPLDGDTYLNVVQFDRNDPSVGRWDFTMNIAVPVPEPETYLMLLIGLVLIGYTLCKRATADIIDFAKISKNS